MKTRLCMISLMLIMLLPGRAVAGEWKSVDQAEELKAFMSGVTLTREEGGERIRGTYHSDEPASSMHGVQSFREAGRL